MNPRDAHCVSSHPPKKLLNGAFLKQAGNLHSTGIVMMVEKAQYRQRSPKLSTFIFLGSKNTVRDQYSYHAGSFTNSMFTAALPFGLSVFLVVRLPDRSQGAWTHRNAEKPIYHNKTLKNEKFEKELKFPHVGWINIIPQSYYIILYSKCWKTLKYRRNTVMLSLIQMCLFKSLPQKCDGNTFSAFTCHWAWLFK